jgi:ABC-type Fe3+-citrate transport system substrate-binding protein
MSDLVIPSVEQHCIIKFLLKEKVKPAEILPRLNAQYGEEILSCASIYDWYNKFSEGRKEASNLMHA